jgi:hypothetical protein
MPNFDRITSDPARLSDELTVDYSRYSERPRSAVRKIPRARIPRPL